jgi:hypothetical protein
MNLFLSFLHMLFHLHLYLLVMHLLLLLIYCLNFVVYCVSMSYIVLWMCKWWLNLLKRLTSCVHVFNEGKMYKAKTKALGEVETTHGYV